MRYDAATFLENLFREPSGPPPESQGAPAPDNLLGDGPPAWRSPPDIVETDNGGFPEPVEKKPAEPLTSDSLLDADIARVIERDLGLPAGSQVLWRAGGGCPGCRYCREPARTDAPRGGRGLGGANPPAWKKR